MHVKNIFNSKSDFKNFTMSERAAFGVVIRFYQNETETTERIKENSLSQTTLFNCVSTITEKLKSEEFPEAFVNEIWDDIKHIRGKKNDDIQNQPIRNMLNLDYEYNANRWYEATIIFACVYMVLALDCPNKENCLSIIKEKGAYNEDAKPYFEPFEQAVIKLKENQAKHPSAYGIETDQPKEEQKKLSEAEWLASEKHFSWKFDKLRTILACKSHEEQFHEYIEECKREENLPNPSKAYLDLLKVQIQYLQRQISQKNNPSINVNDIVDALKDHKFSNERAAELLEIINYALYSKQYPEDICGNLDNKIKLFRQAASTQSEKDSNPDNEESSEKATQKVKSVAIMEMLKLLDKGTAHNDLTDICKFIAFLTGNSHKSIYNDAQNGITFSPKHHAQDIERANELFKSLNMSISIDKQKQY
jgi:hypothetical protein